jgi:hypothetical protein
MMRMCKLCGHSWKTEAKTCAECDSADWTPMVPALGEEWGQDPFWSVEAIYEVDGTEDGHKLEKTLLRALNQWSDYWKGHDFSVETDLVVAMGSGESAIHLMTEIWEFPPDDAVLAVALVQKLAERRNEPGEYDITCRYYDHGEEDED